MNASDCQIVVILTLARHMEPPQLVEALAEFQERADVDTSEGRFFQQMAETLRLYAKQRVKEKADAFRAEGWVDG